MRKNELDAQLSIFRQPLHVSGLSRAIIRGTNVCVQQLVLNLLRCLLSWTTDSHLKRISTNCCIHTVVPPDDGLR